MVKVRTRKHARVTNCSGSVLKPKKIPTFLAITNLFPLERVRAHVGLQFNTHHVLVDWPKDLVYFTNLLLVLKIDGGIEVRHHIVISPQD